MTTYPTARVERDPDTGELILIDPEAVACATAVAKLNCRSTLVANADRVAHFVARITALDRSPDDVMIVVINVDTEIGGLLADALMPGHDWQAVRDAGQVPFARGLAGRPTMVDFVARVDAVEAEKMQRARFRPIVLVVDHGVVAAFDAIRMEALR